MRYLVTKCFGKGLLEVAMFVRRWEAENYAARESGLSGFTYLVEEHQGENDTFRLLSTWNDGEADGEAAA